MSRIHPLLRLYPLFLSAALLASSGPALHAAGDEWSADDIIAAESAASWTISRDGAHAAWTLRTIEKVDGAEKPVSRLWLTRLADGSKLQLTRGNDSVSSPRFSPDGERLAFLSSRERPDADDDAASTQIWIIPVDGGEAWPVTELERDPQGFAWADDDTFIVMAQESPTLWEQGKEKKKDTAYAVEDDRREPPVRLFRVGAKKGKAERISDNDDWLDTLAVSPDGKWAVVTAQQSLSYEFDERVPPHTRLIELASGETTRLFGGTRLVPSSISWSPASDVFYFVNRYSSHPQYTSASIGLVYRHEVAAGTTMEVDLDWERGVARGPVATNDGFVTLLADGCWYRAARYTRDAAAHRRQDLEGTHARNLDSFALGHDGTTLVYAHSTGNTPRQHWSAKLEGKRITGEKQLTELNQGYDEKPTGRVEVITWAGYGGQQIEGLLSWPLDYEEGQNYPLLLNPHGGPAGTTRDTWSQSWASPRLLWRQKGAFVLEPNYHGSAGYGLEFVESISDGKYYELDRVDLINGVELLIERGLVDPDRLGVVGWSNGGILAADMITQSTRWKVASIGAADVEWISDWGNVDFGASFDNYYFGATPLEDPQRYIDLSPFFKLDQVTTPTIIYTGTDDRNVPPHQSWSLFRMMQQLELAPVRLVLFPGEPHGLRKIAHQRRKLAEDLAWFDEHLFESDDDEPEALKKGSPLAALVARKEAASVDGHFGVQENDQLVPELVEHDELQVGRFEVTCAQYGAFAPDHACHGNGLDHPVTGLTFDEAKTYVAWLKRSTGRDFRLPTKSEAEALAEAAGNGGNTLDSWAGYAPNPDDLKELQAVLAGLPGTAPLLHAVGRGTGHGEPAIYDLDGNAAEWASNGEGEGVAVGASADCPKAERDRVRVANAAYRGLRVVIGEVSESDD